MTTIWKSGTGVLLLDDGGTFAESFRLTIAHARATRAIPPPKDRPAYISEDVWMVAPPVEDDARCQELALLAQLADELVEAVATERSVDRRRAMARMLVRAGEDLAVATVEVGAGPLADEIRGSRGAKVGQRGGARAVKNMSRIAELWDIARKKSGKWKACETVAKAERTTPQAVRRAAQLAGIYH
jgi:hypothetical protein